MALRRHASYGPGVALSATSWGATEAERAASYPCDEFAAPDAVGFFRAIDIAAPPPVVFRWLCQLRVAPYSYDLVDNLGRRSPRTLTPGLERVQVGQSLMTIFRLVGVEPDVHLTAVLQPGPSRLFGPIALSYLLEAAPGGSRLVCVQRVGRAGVFGGCRRTALGWGDLVMMRKQLLTLKERAER